MEKIYSVASVRSTNFKNHKYLPLELQGLKKEPSNRGCFAISMYLFIPTIRAICINFNSHPSIAFHLATVKLQGQQVQEGKLEMSLQLILGGPEGIFNPSSRF